MVPTPPFASDNEPIGLTKRVPFWAWIGCGCAGAIGAIVLGSVGVFWGVQSYLGDFADSMVDPTERLETTLEVLHADRLPEGYYAVLAFQIVGYDYVVISDNPQRYEDGVPPELGERNFFFVTSSDAEEWHEFLEYEETGEAMVQAPELLGDLDLDLGERVASGVLDRDEGRITYVSHYGTVEDETLEWESDEGLVSLMLFECAAEVANTWIGVWNGRRPVAETSAAEVDYTGTVADPVEMEGFLTSIQPCR